MLDSVHRNIQDLIDLAGPGRQRAYVSEDIFGIVETQLVRDLGCTPGLLSPEDATPFERHHISEGFPIREIKEPVVGFFDEQYVTIGKVRLWAVDDGNNADTCYILLQNDIDAFKGGDDYAALPKDVAGIFLHGNGLIQAVAAPCDYTLQELPCWFPSKRRNTLLYPNTLDEVRGVITGTLEDKTKEVKAQHIGTDYEELDPLFIQRVSQIISMYMQVYRKCCARYS